MLTISSSSAQAEDFISAILDLQSIPVLTFQQALERLGSSATACTRDDYKDGSRLECTRTAPGDPTSFSVYVAWEDDAKSTWKILSIDFSLSENNDEPLLATRQSHFMGWAPLMDNHGNFPNNEKCGFRLFDQRKKVRLEADIYSAVIDGTHCNGRLQRAVISTVKL